VVNYLVVHFRQRPGAADVRLRDSLYLLENFGHDRNFYAVAWLAVDSAVRLGEFDSLLDMHRKYAMYLERDKNEGEFFPDLFRYMPEVLPCFLDLAKEGWSRDLQERFKRAACPWKQINWVYKAWKNMRHRIGRVTPPGKNEGRPDAS
jgi:hypothetical protein